MGRATQKGQAGEAGVRDFLNQWFPYYESAGIGVDIVTSKGSRDEGDLSGVPWTCIEVKNHSNPVVGTLLDNAEWKASNSGRPVWFLTYKRAGYGRPRAGFWHVCTTVDGFLSGIQPLNDQQEKAFSVLDVEQLCNDHVEMEAEIGAQLPGLEPPQKYRWTLSLMFRSYMRNIEDNRNYDIDEHGLSENERRVPIVIHPRVSRPPGDWYVYTRLAGQARILETMGILPQDETDYADTDLETMSQTS